MNNPPEPDKGSIETPYPRGDLVKEPSEVRWLPLVVSLLTLPALFFYGGKLAYLNYPWGYISNLASAIGATILGTYAFHPFALKVIYFVAFGSAAVFVVLMLSMAS